jgi:hypothetical protein
MHSTKSFEFQVFFIPERKQSFGSSVELIQAMEEEKVKLESFYAEANPEKKAVECWRESWKSP